MADGTKITTIKVTAILAAIAVIGFGATMLAKAWGQGAKHAVEAAQLDNVTDDVAEIKPRINRLEESDAVQTTEIEVLKVQQTAIYKGVERIQQKLDIVP